MFLKEKSNYLLATVSQEMNLKKIASGHFIDEFFGPMIGNPKLSKIHEGFIRTPKNEKFTKLNHKQTSKVSLANFKISKTPKRSDLGLGSGTNPELRG